MPGSETKELVLRIGEFFQAEVIVVGDLMNKEIMMRTAFGIQIKEFVEKMELVPDEIVAEILYKEIQKIDKNKSIIIQGFP